MNPVRAALSLFRRLPGLARCCGLVLAAFSAAACVGPGATAGRTAPLAEMRASPERLIVLSVDNSDTPLSAQAGSTPRAYGLPQAYSAGGRAQQQMSALERDYDLRSIAAWPIQPLAMHCAVLEIPPGSDRGSLLAKLARDPRVRLAQPLQNFATLGAAALGDAPSVAVANSDYNDPYIGLQHGFSQIDAAEAQLSTRGDGVRIAVIDTGMNSAHPDLEGRVAAQKNFVDRDAGQFERDRHGTEVAGIIAAVANNHQGIVGIAPEAHLVALKACWQLQANADSASCNSFTLAQALAAAIDADVRIINLSLGGPADPLLTQLVNLAQKRGIILVGAVPPDGRLDGFPVGIPGVIAVDSAGPDASNAAIVHAPGRDILSLEPDGHYDFASGSSLAAAHVSGVIALLLAEKSGLDADALQSLLKRSHAGDPASEPLQINACLAIAALDSKTRCGLSSLSASRQGSPH